MHTFEKETQINIQYLHSFIFQNIYLQRELCKNFNSFQCAYASVLLLCAAQPASRRYYRGNEDERRPDVVDLARARLLDMNREMSDVLSSTASRRMNDAHTITGTHRSVRIQSGDRRGARIRSSRVGETLRLFFRPKKAFF